MINEHEDFMHLFKEVEKTLNERVEIYVIGGAVLLYEDLKPSTKDIDIIVNSGKEFITLQKIFNKLGFRRKIPGQEYGRMNLNQIFEKEEVRIDLFEKQVYRGFSLSNKMMQRANKILHFDNLKVLHCSREDVFLFKTMTEREGDLDDCLSLARAGINWKSVLDELGSQIKENRQEVWVTWVGERLDILEGRGLIIPIKEQFDKLRTKYFDKLE